MLQYRKSVYASVFLSAIAFGKVDISRQISCSVETLKKIESSIQQAFERDEEMQKYAAFFNIDKNVNLSCGPHLPNAKGMGCTLHLSIKLDGETSIGISKKLLVKGKAKEVEEALKKVDPNTTQEHQHFGSIFEVQDTYGSHYFCQPEGESQKSWGCYLYVHEPLN